MEKTTATWGHTLLCDCPDCESKIDILGLEEYYDIADNIVPGEAYTNKTTNFPVVCPYCGFPFKVDFEY